MINNGNGTASYRYTIHRAQSDFTVMPRASRDMVNWSDPLDPGDEFDPARIQWIESLMSQSGDFYEVYELTYATREFEGVHPDQAEPRLFFRLEITE